MSLSSGPPFWHRCLDSFRERLTPQQFNTWIRPLAVEKVESGYRILAPNRFVLQWVRERFLGEIARLVEQAEGKPVAISLHIAEPAAEAPAGRSETSATGTLVRDEPPSPERGTTLEDPANSVPSDPRMAHSSSAPPPKPAAAPTPPIGAPPPSMGAEPRATAPWQSHRPDRDPSPPPADREMASAATPVAATRPAGPIVRAAGAAGSAAHSRRREQASLNPAFTFEAFVSGKANQLARAAGEQVADNPTAYNPLFVYGGVGLGKTHLVQAIGNRIQQREPHAKIRYIHAEAYVSDVVRAYQHKAFDDFKRYYRSLDLLLIDDIQFFAGKSRTQEEFFYLFNALTEAHKQVVITSDKFPKELPGIEERLISRFNWGLTASLEPPELEMRVAILLAKAGASGLKIDESVAFFIAKHIRSNVRELEGALKRVTAYSNFHGQEVTLVVAKEALRDVLAVQNRQVSVENIQKTVADYYKIRVTDMHSKKRSRIVARPRQVAMALAKELTQLSLPEIGGSFGGRDHTTVLHACRQIAKLRESSNELNYDVNFLLQVLRS